ncbi:hypothetical protein BAE44_0022839, partial [Dichanthelium oligosanthes]
CPAVDGCNNKKRPRYNFGSIYYYQKLGVFGKGTYGVVLRARHRRTAEAVAVGPRHPRRRRRRRRPPRGLPRGRLPGRLPRRPLCAADPRRGHRRGHRGPVPRHGARRGPHPPRPAQPRGPLP